MGIAASAEAAGWSNTLWPFVRGDIVVTTCGCASGGKRLCMRVVWHFMAHLHWQRLARSTGESWTTLTLEDGCSRWVEINKFCAEEGA